MSSVQQPVVLRTPPLQAHLDELAGMRRREGSLSLAPVFKNKTLIAFLLLSEVWLLVGSLWMWWWTVEDAFIGFRYAQNLARGVGLVLNKGERVEGYTNFLWLLLLAAASKMGLDPVFVSKLLGILFNSLAIVACFELCRIASTKKSPMKGLALALTASNGLFIATSVEGLETPLFTMLLCWMLVTYLRGLRDSGQKEAAWLAGSSVISALLMMTRPDGALTYGMLWLHAAWRFRLKPRNALVFTLPAILLYMPYFIWRWHYYGFLFPNTYYAKGGGTLALYALGAEEISKFLSLQTGGLVVAAVVGLLALLFPCTETTVVGLAALSRLIFEFWSGGVTAGNSRFLVPALPLLWLLVERLWATWFGPDRLAVRSAYLQIGVCGLLLAAQSLEFAHFRQAREHDRAGLERAHVSLGHWLRGNSGSGAKVAVGDVGAIGFWSGLRILDLDGLADPYIAHCSGKFGDKGDAHYVLSHRPDFIVLRAHGCVPQPADFLPIDGKIYADPQFQNSFQRLSCWDFDPDYHLLLFARRGHEGGP